MAKAIGLFVFFLCVFNIRISFLPVSPIIIVGVIGSIVWTISSLKNKHRASDYKILGYILLLILIGLISSTINGTFDKYYYKEIIIANFCRFFTAYILIAYLTHFYKDKFTLKFLTYIFLWFAIIQIVISFTVYISPHLYSIIFNLFSSGELSSTKTEGALGIRPFGIGDYAFFGAGLYNCFVLLLISYILIDQSKDSHILFSIGLFLIAILGTILARTNLVGIVISLSIILLNKYGRKLVCKFVIYATIIIALFNLFDFHLVFSDQMETAFQFGFELFSNYQETGSFYSKSTDNMMQMYIYPDNPLTWIIGDARLRLDETTYYMHTDIGILRLIYAIGTIGLLLFLIYQYKIISYASTIFTHNKRLIILAYILTVVVLNLKGLADMSFYFFTLYFLTNAKTQPQNISNCSNL